MNEREQEILEKSGQWQVPTSRSKEEIWLALEKQIDESEETVGSTFGIYKWAAAVALLVLGGIGYFYLSSSMESIETGLAEIKKVELPDGSKAILNAESKISFDAVDFLENRKLSFQGEGYFEVKSGDDFRIDLNGIEVSVLGTSFNIYSRESIKEVKCLTGKVAVSNQGQKLILEKGDMALSANGTLQNEIIEFDEQSAISWQQGEFVFNNVSFARVVKEMEIQYDIEIEMKMADSRYYTGYFDNTNLEKAAKQVFSPMGYSYEIFDKKIVIK
ncbi:FecR family protein [Reichenbachiella sp.]|uniref:FecR family protein n=1 Tax=Reichenbachiella sp. TaxID=2184521 RepID=UPI003BB11CBA